MAKSTKHGGVSDALAEQSMRTGRTPEELAAEQEQATTAPEQEKEQETATPPSPGEPKAAWVDYAVSQGADRDDAESTTKADLIKTYGG